MKKSIAFLGATLALTLIFYSLAYFFLPPPSPSQAMTSLFAGVAFSVIWILRSSFRKRKTKKKGTHAVLAAVSLVPLLLMTSCSPTSNQTAAIATNAGAPATQAPGLPRITGWAILVRQQKEAPGYGLYSYLLLAHEPGYDEIERYEALVRALIQLPVAKDEAVYVRTARINITYLPLVSFSPDWEQLTTEERINYALSHYDYARGAALLASLPRRTGPGPVVVSVMTPLSLERHPHPVLVQDLSLAQPSLMEDYVSRFVNQVSGDHFWKSDTLSDFALALRNALETAAVGLGLSRDAVKSWVQFYK